MEVRRRKPIEQILDDYNISWTHGDTEGTLRTVKMFEDFISKQANSDNYVFDVSLVVEEEKFNDNGGCYRSAFVLNNPYAA